MSIPIFTVDAFTSLPFGGNQAAVCVLGEAAPDAWMGAVAAELNLPETAFVWPAGDRRWGLRWWTPTVEVPLCGHGTLAAAHVLAERGDLPEGGTATFDTRSGPLTARIGAGRVTLDFPAYERWVLDVDAEQAVRAVAGADALEVVGYGPKVLAVVADRSDVLRTAPDLAGLAALPYEGLVVTAPTDVGYVLRFFAPALGIAEDPVTGSAQCAAGPYWHERRGGERFAVEQLSPRRGQLDVTVTGAGRVLIGGAAVTVIRGTLASDPGGGREVAPPWAQPVRPSSEA